MEFAHQGLVCVVSSVVEFSVGSACQSTARVWHHSTWFAQAALDSPSGFFNTPTIVGP